jgi:hypothetical protein
VLDEGARCRDIAGCRRGARRQASHPIPSTSVSEPSASVSEVSAVPGVRDTVPDPAPSPPVLPGEPAAGAVLLRGGPFIGLAVGVVVVTGAVLVPAGLWRPAVVLPILLVGLSLAWRLTGLLPVRPVPVWSTALSVALALGEGVWAAATHAEHVVLRRDPGSYALYAQWIATRHGLPVQAHLDAFGGGAALAVPGFTLDSPAYYQVLHGGTAHLVPQFLGGAPAVFSLGWWAGGWSGLLLMPAVAGAAAIFVAASLTARLVGPRWAPLAAGSLAVTYPVLHAARSTYSEPVALVLVLTAAAVIADATTGARHLRTIGLVGGVTLGVAGLVRVDALTEIALALPVCAVLALRRHPATGGLVAGLAGSTVLAAASALLTSRPYLQMIAGSLVPLTAGTVVLAIGCAVVVAVGRARGRGSGPRVGTADGVTGTADGVPGSGQGAADDAGAGRRVRAGQALLGRAVSGRTVAALVLLLGAALTSRPLWQTVRQSTDDSGAPFVAGLQMSQHLAVDGSRTYAEWSLIWVIWWVGPVLVIAAWIGFAALARHTVGWLATPTPVPDLPPGTATMPRSAGPWGAGGVPVWLLPVVVGFGSAVLTLWRPGITPDHPWADRRLVPVLLPTFVIVGTGVTAVSVRWARRRLPATLLVTAVATGVIALFGPPLVATAPLAGQRTEAGELGVVRSVCGALAPGDAVVAIDNRGFNEWPQVVRGVCDHPAASLQVDGSPLPPDRLRASVDRLGRLVAAHGGRLVLLASADDVPPQGVLSGLGLQPREVARLVTAEDQRVLARAPTRGSSLKFSVWLATWTAS